MRVPDNLNVFLVHPLQRLDRIARIVSEKRRFEVDNYVNFNSFFCHSRQQVIKPIIQILPFTRSDEMKFWGNPPPTNKHFFPRHLNTMGEAFVVVSPVNKKVYLIRHPPRGKAHEPIPLLFPSILLQCMFQEVTKQEELLLVFCLQSHFAMVGQDVEGKFSEGFACFPSEIFPEVHELLGHF